MHRLAILKFCRNELARRQARDESQGWFWGIRGKVVDYWIAVLERKSDLSESGGGDALRDLSAMEREELFRTHPLLASRPYHSAVAVEFDCEWRLKIDRRVETYIAAVKAHR